MDANDRSWDASSLHRCWETGFDISKKQITQIVQTHTVGYSGLKSGQSVRGPAFSHDIPDILSELQLHLEKKDPSQRLLWSDTLYSNAHHFNNGVHDTCDMLKACNFNPIEMVNILKLATLKILDESIASIDGKRIPGLTECKQTFRQSLLEDLGFTYSPWHHAIKDPLGVSNPGQFHVSEEYSHPIMEVFKTMGRLASEFVRKVSILDIHVGEEPSIMVKAYTEDAANRLQKSKEFERNRATEIQEIKDRGHKKWVNEMTQKHSDFLDISSLDPKSLSVLRTVSTARDISERAQMTMAEIDKIFRKNDVPIPRRVDVLPVKKKTKSTQPI